MITCTLTRKMSTIFLLSSYDNMNTTFSTMSKLFLLPNYDSKYPYAIKIVL